MYRHRIFESTFREYAERGCDLIMSAGSQFDEAVATVAPNYPDTTFCVVNGSKCDGDNVAPIFPEGIRGKLCGVHHCRICD